LEAAGTDKLNLIYKETNGKLSSFLKYTND
jgi:hypothetical protein